MANRLTANTVAPPMNVGGDVSRGPVHWLSSQARTNP